MADDGGGKGFQLMQWDGQQLNQIKPASAFSVNPSLYANTLIPYHMGLYFEGSYDASKLELWRVRDTLNTATGPMVQTETRGVHLSCSCPGCDHHRTAIK
jgi:hypothetical protein